MKHVTTTDKSLLIGDTAAVLLMEYGALLGQKQSADDVTLRAHGADGDPVDVTFLLNSGVTLLIESSVSEIPEPDNAEGEQYMLDHIRLLTFPPNAQPSTRPVEAVWEI